MEVWPGEPFPLGATWDGEGTNFALFSEHAERVELCLFDRRPRDARRPPRRHRARLALLPARHRPRATVRLPRPRPLRPRPGAPLQPAQAPDRPLREGDRGAGALGAGKRPPVRAGPGGGRRPRARRLRRRRGDPEVRRRRPGLRLGGRRTAADALERHRDLRGAREGPHRAPSRDPGRPARHVRRSRLRAGAPLPARARRDGGRAAPDPPHRRRELPPRARPDELLGLLVDRLPRSRTRSTRRPGRAASRCASSRGWSRRCTGPGSR